MKLSLMAGALALIATQSLAQSQCGPSDTVAETLRGQFGEMPLSEGVMANGLLMTTWANPDTGTWTITINSGGGVECLVASGDGFSEIAPEPNL